MIIKFKEELNEETNSSEFSHSEFFFVSLFSIYNCQSSHINKGVTVYGWGY